MSLRGVIDKACAAESVWTHAAKLKIALRRSESFWCENSSPHFSRIRNNKKKLTGKLWSLKKKTCSSLRLLILEPAAGTILFCLFPLNKHYSSCYSFIQWKHRPVTSPNTDDVISLQRSICFYRCLLSVTAPDASFIDKQKSSERIHDVMMTCSRDDNWGFWMGEKAREMGKGVQNA